METLEHLQRLVVYMANIIVHGRDIAEHYQHLQRVVKWLACTGLKLNGEKCALRQRKLLFLGHEIDADSVRPDLA